MTRSRDVRADDPLSSTLADTLNRDCFCIGTDLPKLHAWLERDVGASLVDSHPHLFSALPVFVSRAQIDRMQAVIDAVEHVVGLPAWREIALAGAPEVARRAAPNPGVLMGYDFHLSGDAPQLIEINTNAGGVLLNAALARAQRACCPEVEGLLCGGGGERTLEDEIADMFLEEWRLARGDAPLAYVAIVDRDPDGQYLYPEFVLFRRLFESRGIEARIVDAGDLSFDGSALRHDGRRVDLVYNRLTDFYFEAPESDALRRAWLADAVVVTPHPHAHALYANKRNLVHLTTRGTLARIGAHANTIATLLGGIPETVAVGDVDAEALWESRKAWFFKPARGYGSRGSYRGDKLTRKTFAAIRADDYVAQRLVPPSHRFDGSDEAPVALKIDLRNYVYRGRVAMVVARLYRGQTTNFRTPGGGFAPVFHPRDDGSCGSLVAGCSREIDPAGLPAGSIR